LPAEKLAPGDPRAAIIVCLDFGDDGYEEGVEEVVRLAQSAGVARFSVVKGKRQRPDARLYAGSGKVVEIGAAAAKLNAAFVIFNHELSPAQARNVGIELERQELDLRVMDRTELILEIFSQRAQTNEGKLQVELARLQHLATRLVRGWSHLERQRGGLGKTGGPGEKQIELDRRYLAARVKTLKAKLGELQKRRSVQRRGRVRRDVPSISIVGYTNAGKSTLLNTLTRSDVLAEDKLFATLDPTTRRLRFPYEREIIIADTVGFIRDLPRDLAQAFRATLEELDEADLLLHVVDAADPAREQQMAAVEAILSDLGLAETPRLVVLNKMDLVPEEERDTLVRAARADGGRPVVAISAQHAITTTPLLAAIEEALWRDGHLVRESASPAEVV